MPSEKIVNSRYGNPGRVLDPGDTDLKVGDETPGDDSFLKVQWHRETGIDVGLTVMRESDDEVENDRLCIWLDRRGVNALIRVLRKAGGQTFGRDEW